MANSSRKAATAQRYDLLLLVDATSSMSTFLKALNKSLPEIIALSALSGCFERIGVACYRDYCDSDVTEWSGWCSPSGAVTGPDVKSEQHVLDVAKGLKAKGGGDMPEAAKSGLALAYSKMRPDATTVILIYADAPPHLYESKGQNRNREISTLKTLGGHFSEDDAKFVDLRSIGHTLRHGEKRGVVFPILYGKATALSSFMCLSTLTGGSCLNIADLMSTKISRATIGLLLAFMGLGGTTEENDDTDLGTVTSHKNPNDVQAACNEKDLIKIGAMPKEIMFVQLQVVEKNIVRKGFSLPSLPSLIEARGPALESLEIRYKTDNAYKATVMRLLEHLISVDVLSISLNPVFGGLWREVCKDRDNPQRVELMQAFGKAVENLKAPKKKERLKSWLERSYDCTTEINELIATVKPEDRFPLVYLDPTQDFSEHGEELDGTPYRAANAFSRTELLEINRSCDQKTLRRIGKVLTLLGYAQSESDLPAHIKASDSSRVTCIPLALASQKYGRRFWSIILHAILPGTMLSVRGGALVAALSLRMSIVPFREAADAELMRYQPKWNDLNQPESWSFGCLNLLLQADADFEGRVASGSTSRPTETSCILSTPDRAVFSTLIDYKMLEFNLDTNLEAYVGWSPSKDKSPIGPLVVCTRCEYPRSVTAMSTNGICGLCSEVNTTECICPACIASNGKKTCYLQVNISKDMSPETEAHWVECCNANCRAQYVVYNPKALNVRAKCFYCRQSEADSCKAPTVQCQNCRSKIVWPEEYRSSELDLANYQCPACTNGRKSIVGVECTARILSAENGIDWLIQNDNRAVKIPFNGKSIYHLVSVCNLGTLCADMGILPVGDVRLTLGGKDVKNTKAMIRELRDWITTRKVEQGNCGLCFGDIRKSDLVRVCGRSGCPQQVCNCCRDSWYGLNGRGKIINMAALSCPFCRRHPTPKIASKYRLTTVGNLADAIAEAGEWIYAWCRDCGFAKRYLERICAAGAPADTGNFRCEDCSIGRYVVLDRHGNETGRVRVPKHCPGCKVMTEKTYGCDHITCPCGMHWCYQCGGASTERDIYRHIAANHDGMEWEYDDDDDEAENWH